VTPADGAADVDPAAEVTASFSRAIDPCSVTPASAFVRPVGGPAIDAEATLSPDGLTLTLAPTAPLAISTTFEVVFTTALAAPDGAALVADAITSFATTDFALLRPVDGDGVVENRPLALEAVAGPGLPLERVEFYAGGVLVGSLEDAPYVVEIITPRTADQPTLTIEARAVSAADLVLVSDTATVQVVVDVDATPRVLGVELGGVGTVRLRLSGSFGEDVGFTLDLVDPTIAALSTEAVVIPAGETEATVELSGLAAGATSFRAVSPLGATGAVVSVSAPVSGQSRRADAPSVNLATRPAGDLGRLYLPVGGSRTLLLPLVTAPVVEDTTASARSADPAVAAVGSESVIAAGARTASFTVTAGAPGRTTLVFEVAGRSRDLVVVVGPPVGENGRRVSAPSVNLEVTP